jgi:hypothetical protein
MSDADTPSPRVDFPLTRLIRDLHSASTARRLAADPEKTAAHYGIPVDRARFYITQAQRDLDVWPIKSGGRK